MHTRRTIGLLLLGIVLIGSTMAVAIVATLVDAFGRRTAFAMVIGSLAVLMAAYVFVIGPWHRRWGATPEEVAAPLPGDDLLPPGAASTTRAITIAAPPGQVFPWLVQIGFGKAGWYSYDLIDNDGEPSADEIHPEWQDLTPGDRIVMMPPDFGPIVRAVERDDHIVSAGDADSWCLQLRPSLGGGTRLISRWRQAWPKGPATALWTAIADPGAFIMERKMLRTLKRRAESTRLTW